MNGSADYLGRSWHKKLRHLESRIIRLKDVGKGRDRSKWKLGELRCNNSRQVERSVYSHCIPQGEQGVTQQGSGTSTSHSRKVSVLEYTQPRADSRGSSEFGSGGADDGGIAVVLDSIERIKHVGGGVGSEVDEEGEEERGEGCLRLGSPFSHGGHGGCAAGGFVEDEPIQDYG